MSFSNLLCFSDLSYLHLIWSWSKETYQKFLWNKHRSTACVSQTSKLLNKLIFLGWLLPIVYLWCLHLEKQWTVPALWSTRAEAGQGSEHHRCGRKGKPTASIQRAQHLVPAILCLHSDLCVLPPGFSTFLLQELKQQWDPQVLLCPIWNAAGFTCIFLPASQRAFAFPSHQPQWLHRKNKYYPALCNSFNYSTNLVPRLICFLPGLYWCLTCTSPEIPILLHHWGLSSNLTDTWDTNQQDNLSSLLTCQELLILLVLLATLKGQSLGFCNRNAVAGNLAALLCSWNQLCGWRTTKRCQAQLQHKKWLQRFVSPLQAGCWARVTCRTYHPHGKLSGLLGFLEIFLCFSLKLLSLNTVFKIRWESWFYRVVHSSN